MRLELDSPCKVNLLLNILGKREDGYHELETVLLPLPICDRLELERVGAGVQLSCSEPGLPVDASNLVHRAATVFLERTGIAGGIRVHLVKQLPLAAGLGGGSANAAVTLSGLNRLFDEPLTPGALRDLAAGLGSDVPFFLQSNPAVATGRGEQVEPVGPFAALHGTAILLIKPRFGVPTAWAYRELSKYPDRLHGQPGRAATLLERLRLNDLSSAAPGFFNSLECPVGTKYPVLPVLKDFLLENGAIVALLSGSGSTTFAITGTLPAAETLRERVLGRFGAGNWTAIARMS